LTNISILQYCFQARQNNHLPKKKLKPEQYFQHKITIIDRNFGNKNSHYVVENERKLKIKVAENFFEVIKMYFVVEAKFTESYLAKFITKLSALIGYVKTIALLKKKDRKVRIKLFSLGFYLTRNSISLELTLLKS
jgi:hypothetical protein